MSNLIDELADYADRLDPSLFGRKFMAGYTRYLYAVLLARRFRDLATGLYPYQMWWLQPPGGQEPERFSAWPPHGRWTGGPYTNIIAGLLQPGACSSQQPNRFGTFCATTQTTCACNSLQTPPLPTSGTRPPEAA